MTGRLYAERYLTDRARKWKLDEFIVNDLPGLDLPDTLDFYQRFHAWSRDPQDRGLLAANDRFYLFTQLLKRKDGIHPWLFDRCREVEAEPDGCLDLWARFHYKDLDVRTKVLTTSGWTTHGALKVGDHVFGADGKPKKVLATRRFTDSACRRITFDNGISIVCGAGHLWTVDVPSRERIKGTANRRKARKQITVETDALRELQTTYRPIVRTAEPLDLPSVDLPIDPYVLGAWLGDGTSSDGSICGIDHEVFDHIRAAGYTLTNRKVGEKCHKDFRMHGIKGLRVLLRSMSLLDNKHIPDAYIFASSEQRLALLQGLIDTDGSASPDNGCITFAQTNKRFAEQVQFLAISLGFKARLSPVRAGTGSWHVVFQSSAQDRPCRITRKLALLPTRERRPGSQGWRVHSIEDVETVETNCIQVDSPDGLYLVGEHLVPTHNSSINTFAGIIQEIIRDPEITICIFSYTKPIASKFLSQIMKELERNEDLQMSCKDVFWFRPKVDAPSWSLGGGITVIRTSNPKEATVEAHGLDAQPTSKHFKLLVYDDVVVKKSVTNATQIAKTTENWELSDNLGVGEATRKWMLGTRYDLADTYAEIIERKIVKVRLYPATHNGKLTGRPVFMSEAQWEKVKRTQRKTVAAQMLQNPAEGGEVYFNLAWLKAYETRPSRLNVYIMVDPASSKKKDSDRTAMAVIGVDERKNKYLLDGFCHRMSALERWKCLKILHQKWSAMPGVETVDVGYERYGAQSDIEWMLQRMQDANEAYSFPIKELNTPIDGDVRKIDRISRLQPDIEGSEYKFFFPCVVWRPNAGDDVAGGMVFWSYNSDKGDFVWSPAEKLKVLGTNEDGSDRYSWTGELVLTKAQKAMISLGEPHRNAKPIVRKDEEGKLYDVTITLFEELRYFPKRKGHDDLIDATSRIYDMQYVGPPTGRELERLEGPGPAH